MSQRTATRIQIVGVILAVVALGHWSPALAGLVLGVLLVVVPEVRAR